MLFISLAWIIVLVSLSCNPLPADAKSIPCFPLRQVRAGGFFGDAFREVEEVPFCFSFADLILTQVVDFN